MLFDKSFVNCKKSVIFVYEIVAEFGSLCLVAVATDCK